MNILKKVILWIAVAFFGFMTFVFFPSISSILFFLGALVLLPIKKYDELLEKIKIKLWLRIVIAVIFLVIGILITPDGEGSSGEDSETEDVEESMEKKRKKSDGESPEGNSEERESSGEDERGAVDEKQEWTRQDVTGTWSYESERAIAVYYEFWADGTWRMTSEGGDENSGTYEITDGNVIKMAGNSWDVQLTILSSKVLMDESGDKLTRYSEDEDPYFTGESNEDPNPYDGDSFYHPVYDFDGTGNFNDIDYSVWEKSSLDPKRYVGRWYEDGWTNGYYLELYGDGTWQYFGGEVLSGRYSVGYNDWITLEDGIYGVNVADCIITTDTGKGFSVTVYQEELFLTHTPPPTVGFTCERDSKACSDLNGYYREKYPYAGLQGKWYPVNDYSGSHYFEFGGEGNWGEIINNAALEVGLLTEKGDGSFYSYGGNTGVYRTFEFADDGYMYVDGEAYAKRTTFGAERIADVVGTWHFWDMNLGDLSELGYVFYDDCTFESLPDGKERGTFFFVGDNLLLYDENGYRIHKFYQNEFMAAMKSLHDDNPMDELEDLYFEE